MKLSRHFRGMIPLFVLGHFSHHVLTSITTPLLPYIRNSFNLDYTQTGLVVSAFMLSYGLGHLPAGWLADRVEPRKLMTIGISGVALVGIMIGLSQTYLLLIAFLILMGLLAGGYHPSAPALISSSVQPEKLGGALGLHNIGGGASHLVTPLVAVAIAVTWGWRTAFVALAIPTLIFGVVFYFLLGRMNKRERENPPPEREEAAHALSRKQRLRRLTIFLVLTTITGAIINSAVSFLPLLFVDQFGMRKHLAAASLSILFTAVFWASPLGGHLADRVGSMRVILWVTFCAGPLIFLTSIISSAWGITVLLLLLGTVIFARMSASEAYLIQIAPADTRSTVLGIYFFAGMEGGAIITPLLGYIIDHMSFTVAYALAGGTSFVATLICSFWLWEPAQKLKKLKMETAFDDRRQN